MEKRNNMQRTQKRVYSTTAKRSGDTSLPSGSNTSSRQSNNRRTATPAKRPRQTTGSQTTPRNKNKSTHSNTRGARRRSTTSHGLNAGERRHALRKNAPRIARKKDDDVIPPIGDNIRVIPLGGVEEVGKNMIAVEFRNDILVFDAGFQFVTEEETPGIDYILPNTKYLEDNKDKVRAVIVTHGHLDHIGGIPYIMERIGNPKIYTRALTRLMIEKRQSEFPHLPKLDIHTVTTGDNISIGSFKLSFHAMTHSIPDAMAISAKTPYGNIVITGDLKLDHVDGNPTDEEKKVWGEIGKENNLLFISDSTNVQNPGFSKTETQIHKTIDEMIKNVPGRLFIGTFASQFERMIKIVEIAEKYGKKVVTEGRSIKTNIEIAQLAGLLKPKKDTIIPAQDIEKYPSNKILVLATGAQGEEFAALMRISNKKDKNISFNERDTIILSSSVIPGNEINVQRLKDNLYRHKLHIIHYRTSDVHASGHGNAGELAWVNKMVGAKFFMPAYGFYSMLMVHAQVIKEAGILEEKDIIVPEGNGAILEIRDKGKTITQLKERAPSGIVMVDGLAIGDIQEVVIRDRKMLAQDGMFVIIATINLRTGKLKKSPDIISRGFIYLRESQDLLQETRVLIKKTIEETVKDMRPINFDYVKNSLSDSVSLFLFQKTNKRPLVIPVLLSV